MQTRTSRDECRQRHRRRCSTDSAHRTLHLVLLRLRRHLLRVHDDDGRVAAAGRRHLRALDLTAVHLVQRLAEHARRAARHHHAVAATRAALQQCGMPKDHTSTPPTRATTPHSPQHPCNTYICDVVVSSHGVSAVTARRQHTGSANAKSEAKRCRQCHLPCRRPKAAVRRDVRARHDAQRHAAVDAVRAADTRRDVASRTVRAAAHVEACDTGHAAAAGLTTSSHQHPTSTLIWGGARSARFTRHTRRFFATGIDRETERRADQDPRHASATRFTPQIFTHGDEGRGRRPCSQRGAEGRHRNASTHKRRARTTAALKRRRSREQRAPSHVHLPAPPGCAHMSQKSTFQLPET